jgi:hypothetical protein
MTQSSNPTSIPSSSAFVLAVDEPSLDLAALGGRVAGAVRRQMCRVSEPLGREAVDELGCLAALGETQRAHTAFHERGHQPGSLAERAGAQSELLVGERRIPEGDRPFRPGRGVAVDHGHLDTE